MENTGSGGAQFKMKNHDINDLMSFQQTLNECQRLASHADHSIGELDGVSMKKITVQFAPLSEPVFEVKIRRAQKRPVPTRSLNSTVLLAAARAAMVTMY